jgi:hypothetical protein
MQQTVKQLIDKAAAQHGGKAAVGRELGVSPQQVSAWYAGRDPCPIDVQAMLADLAGEPVTTLIKEIVLEKAASKPWRAKLEAALKKSVAGVVATLLSSGGNGGSDSFAVTPGLRPSTDNV